jgi:OmcA/MtrC family decaheme c-type cytochrome
VAANAPSTTGVTVNFRTLLHQIHGGRDLVDADFRMVGDGAAPYPDNYSVNDYTDNLFPARPGAAMQCRRCHGETNEAWKPRAERDHPLDQVTPVQAWRAACLACHDSSAALAHAEIHTSLAGNEACQLCHGPSEPLDVETVHEPR